MKDTQPADLPPPPQSEEAALLMRRFDRERAARKAAEGLLNSKSLELFEAVSRARESEHRLQMALWASGEGIWEWRVDQPQFVVTGLVVDGQEVEWPRADARSFIAMIHPDDRDAMVLAWRLHLGGAREDVDMAYRIRLSLGERWVRVRGRALERDAQGQPQRIVGTIKDITAQRESEQSLHLLANAFASTHEALLVVDEQWRIMATNQAFSALTGLDAQGVRGQPLAICIALPDKVGDGGNWRGESQLRGVDRVVPVEVGLTFVAG